MRKVTPALVLTVTAFLVSLGGDARASDPAMVEDLIRHANELRREGKDADAFPLLKHAYELGHSPRTSAQLGLVELALGYWVDADQHLTEALASANHPWVDRNREVLAASRTKARKHIATITIDGQPRGSEVHLNDVLIGNLPLGRPITVAEGEVVVKVSAPKHRAETRTMNLVGGDVERMSFALEPFADTVTTTGAPVAGLDSASVRGTSMQAKQGSSIDDRRPAWRRALPWTLLIATLATSGFSIWQHIRSQRTVHAFDAIPACGSARPQHGANDECASLYDRFTTERRNATFGYTAAGILGAGSAAAFAWNANDTHNNAEHAIAFSIIYGRSF